MFDALGISGSGMLVHQTWLTAISDNIANINTVRRTSESAFQARYVLAQSVEGSSGRPGEGALETGAGVAVGGIELGSAVGRLTYQPDHPLADANGMVRLPDIDLGEQMTTMIAAQRGFQANVANLDRVKETYQSAIQMGRN